MDSNTFVTEIMAELESIPNDQKLTHIKARLLAIKDLEERAFLENIFLMVQSLGHITQKLVIILIHGIRTQGKWQDTLEDELVSVGITDVYKLSYRFYDLASFWIPIPFLFRIFPINHIKQEMRIVQSAHPNDEIVVVAHSFGTYIISKILPTATDLKIKRLLLCGSIIKEGYKWDRLNFSAKGNVINDCGTKDFLPLLAKTSTFGYGASGTLGFRTHVVESRYHEFGHSDFFSKKVMKKFWLPFILDGKVVTSNTRAKRAGPPWLATILSLFPGQLFLMITGLVCYFVYW